MSHYWHLHNNTCKLIEDHDAVSVLKITIPFQNNTEKAGIPNKSVLNKIYAWEKSHLLHMLNFPQEVAAPALQKKRERGERER